MFLKTFNFLLNFLKFCSLISLIILFLIACPAKNVISINSGNIYQIPDNKNSLNNQIFYNYADFEKEFLHLIQKPREKGKFSNIEWDFLKYFIRNCIIKSNSLPIIIDDSGLILVHQISNFENTNIKQYSDYENGLKAVYTADFLTFFYINNKRKYHVSSLYIKELNIRSIIITLYFVQDDHL